MKANPYRLAILTLVALMALAACMVMPSPIPMITIRAADYSFTGPTALQAGLVTITLENDGQEPHHIQLVRLNDGVTMAQFEAALQQSDTAIFPLIQLAGGPGAVAPGQRQQVTVQLIAGHYVLLCFVPDSMGMPHFAKGMVAALEVTAGTHPMVELTPEAEGVVKLLDFSFVLPTSMKAGKQIWQIVNEGKQPHEIALVRLADGKTLDDAVNFMQAPTGAPPFIDVGGFQGIDPGASGWLHLDLQPGRYVALCHIPDPASGKPHEALGMVLPFTVE